MKALRNILAIVFAFICTNHIDAAKPTPVDGQVDIFETEKKTLLQRIAFEKTRIAEDYKSADNRLFNLVDSTLNFILEQPVTKEKRNLYLQRLQIFLSNINRYYSDSYLKQGTYLAVLSYYPSMIEWDQKDELLRNIKRYSAFSIKATRLIPNDTTAEDFLTEYLSDHPDDIFRYTEEFDERGFATHLLERALRLAPESAKRYYTSTNAVSDLLSASKDPYAKASFQIYNKYGVKSRAYLLLDAIVKSNMTVAQADSIGNNPDQMFHLLVDWSMKYEANVTYSIYRYLDAYCIDAMRKISQETYTSTAGFERFNKYSSEEMFVLLSYGNKEANLKTFLSLVSLLRKKSTATPISSVMINSMDKDKLKELVIYCDKNQVLQELLSMVDDDKKDYLLALTTIEEKENLFPPFKTFTNETKVANDEPEDKALNEIVKARSPKIVAADTLAEKPTSGTLAKNEPPAKQIDFNKTGEENEANKVVMARPATGSGNAAAGSDKSLLALANAKASASNTLDRVDIASIPAAPEVVEPIKIVLDERSRTLITMKKNILQALQHIPSFIDKDYAEEILLYAAQKEPDEVFKHIEAFKSKVFCKKVLEQCAINAPVSVKRYLYNAQHPVNVILQYSQNNVVKKIIETNPHLGYRSKPLLLIDDIINGKMSLSNAVVVSDDPGKLFSAMVKTVSSPRYVGKYSLDREMRDYSLKFVREINDNIATGNAQPFNAAEDLNANELYFLMLYGRDEVFTSTFNGLFNRFMQKLPKGDGEAFLHSVSYNQFRDFLSLCSNYGTLEEFLSKFNNEAKRKLMVSYISNLESEKDDLSTVVLIAEAASNLLDNQLLTIVQTTIKSEYERVKKTNDQIGISIYGVLSSMISGNAKAEASWYKHVSQEFRISPVGTLSSNTLFAGERCIEQMYFYNDGDGKSSFVNFMNTYKNQPAWSIDDRNSYVCIKSKTGMNVEIYVNKPEFEENGIAAIQAYLLENKLTPTVVVHRGHSFHTEATLEKIPQSARLIFVGSCGGFYKIPIALENAPDAHIISTKQVGTKTVNDIMIFALNENIRNGKDIIWSDFWDKMRDKLGNNQYFGDYVPPHKNLEAIFIRAYYKTLGV